MPLKPLCLPLGSDDLGPCHPFFWMLCNLRTFYCTNFTILGSVYVENPIKSEHEMPYNFFDLAWYLHACRPAYPAPSQGPVSTPISNRHSPFLKSLSYYYHFRHFFHSTRLNFISRRIYRPFLLLCLFYIRLSRLWQSQLLLGLYAL